MTLSLYVARRFGLAFLGVLLVFTFILGLLDMVEQIRRFAGDNVSFSQAAGLAALDVPSSLYRILPLTMILSAIVLFLGLARTSELVVIRAAGRSALSCLVAPVLTALAIGVLAVTVLNPIVAATSNEYETLSTHYSQGEENVLSISREGVWLRQGSADGQMVIRAAKANSDATVLHDATFISLNKQAQPTTRVEARVAHLQPGAWKLTDAKVWRFDKGPNAEKTARDMTEMTLPSDLTQAQIRDSFGPPSAVPIWQLPGFIDRLEKAGFSARQHRVWLQMELALPLLLAAMVLVGAGFTMRHARSGGTGLMVLLALMAGFGIFFLRNFAQVLGENGQIPVPLAAWSPPVVAVLLALGFLLHLEEG
ncbi:LPS export ABC transporter permease LptG [Acidimangrovimonas sediminis]|uniref:LPS export ABC transporter permease LptG n=1 Tax=Acidimangrovimonas sediminis TaxID=2056283 RepID=UPI000C800B91|nr:LPS export ABC transporter permease LptG [Acidimangrovimonas sediminis]